MCYHIASVSCFLIFWLCGVWSLSSPTTDWICSPCIGRWSLTIWSPRNFLIHIFTGFSFLDFRSLWSWLSSVSPQGELDTLYLVSIRHWFLSSLSTPTFSYPPKDGGAWWAAVSGVAQGRTRLKRFSSSSSSKTIGDHRSCREWCSVVMWPVRSTFLPFYCYSLLNRHKVISVCDQIELLGKQSFNFSSWVLLFTIRLR